ncbi:MAG: S-layer homology domain-containing protein [Oscillospiraceae bacterium]|nr:S-layer homology domain-containing protein [Oscillospiraceae bacterium]
MHSFMITLLLCSASMSVLSVLYIGLHPLFARWCTPKAYYSAGLILALGLLIPFRPQFGGSIIALTPADAAAPVAASAELAQGGGQNAGAVIPITYPDAPTAGSFPLSWWQVAGIIWLVGMAVFLAYHLFRHARFVKTANRWSERVTDDASLSLFHRLTAEMRIRKQIGLYRCSLIGSPMLLGWAHPKILLPDAQLDAEDLTFILTHELVHYQHRDIWNACLILAATAVHWFNPVAHLYARELHLIGEMACDAAVVQGMDAHMRQDYSETIISVVKYQARMSTALSTSFYGGKTRMKKRIISIMDARTKRAGAVITAAALLLTIGSGAVFGVDTALDQFSDAGSIVNQEAVSTLVSLNVISGRDNGTFDPTGNVTRAEMCKMIAVVLCGGSEIAGAATPNTTDTFQDTSSHWARNYIEYCANMSIVSGDGTGLFYPDRTVTGSECAKMLLVALGYNAEVFGLTGPQWEALVNARAYSEDANLYQGLSSSLDPSSALTRDSAAQMVYNALNAKVMIPSYGLDEYGVTVQYSLGEDTWQTVCFPQAQ